MIPAVDEPMLLADGFEPALVGWYTPWGSGLAVAIYDREKCIKILMKRNKWPRDEAEEFFEFNTEGAYVGERTPIFMHGCSYHVLSSAYGVGNGEST